MAAETLAPTIERVRKAAGSVSPSLDALNAALHDLIARHSKAVFEGFLTIQSAAAPVYACTTRVLASPNPDRIEALDSIIRAYGQFIGPELSRYEERVKAAWILSARNRRRHMLLPASPRRSEAGMFWVLH